MMGAGPATIPYPRNEAFATGAAWANLAEDEQVTMFLPIRQSRTKRARRR
jgi:hypothetical protein